jgi:hypothetical protein
VLGFLACGVRGEVDIGLRQPAFATGLRKQFMCRALPGARQRFERNDTAGVQAVQRLEGELDNSRGRTHT